MNSSIKAGSSKSLSTSLQQGSSKSNTISITKQLELNDVPVCAHEPGPGHYFGPDSKGFSSLEKNPFSGSQSAPAISLPRTGWDEWSNVVISKGHAATFKARDSPGAAYQVPTTLSKLGAKIGTSLRPDLNLSLGIDPHGSPGPTVNLRDQQAESEAVASRKDKGFGQAPRFGAERRNNNIGPGQYARKDFALSLDVGKTIGCGRQAWEKVVTPGWEVEGRCRASPGPGPPLSSDVVSKDGTKFIGNRVCSIGKAERFPASRYESCSPGPAAYRSPMSQREERLHHSTSTTSSGKPINSWGAAAKKPRFRMVLALNCSKNSGWGYF